jgi:cytochrome P450
VHVLRTVTRPTEIAGVSIAEGDRVTAWNVSANRDESVFADPDRFALDRSPNRHVTFGVGRHFCIGARVARLEMTAFLNELRTRVTRIELTGEPKFNSSNFTWGLHTLPVRLVPAA